LAENVASEDGYGRLQTVRFVWGKSWNVPGIVAAIAERLEYFTPEGAPQRSWLRMRLLRVEEPAAGHTYPGRQPAQPPELLSAQTGVLPEGLGVHEITGGTSGAPGDDRGAGERLDEIAQRTFGDPSYWRLVAALNDIDDPLHIPPGQLLQVPTFRGQR
jgi:hypothetical protein